jgi:hypothetical protein
MKKGTPYLRLSLLHLRLRPASVCMARR